MTPWIAFQAPLFMGLPGKNTGVGCHFLPQCMKVKSESEVAQSCPTLSDPMDCSPPGSSIHGIFQARVLEWGAIAFSIQGIYVLLNYSNVSTSHSVLLRRSVYEHDLCTFRSSYFEYQRKCRMKAKNKWNFRSSPVHDE